MDELRERLEEVISEQLDAISIIKDKTERLNKANYLFNIYKILENYEALEPTLRRFFDEQHQRNKYKTTDVSWDSISK